MKHVHRPSAALAAATLLAVSGAAMGQAPAIDGTLDASYGPALWVNTQNPTGFGDNVQGNFPCSDFGSGMQLAINNSNTGGVPGGPGTCEASGAGVTTGIEIKIPFAAIANPTQATFKIAGFIIGQQHDFISNQVIGGSTNCLENLGEPRLVTFDDADAGGIAGNQFITVTNGSDTDPTGPAIDGTLDAAFYGSPLWVNNVETGFGDNNVGEPGAANGSELDAAWARVVTVDGEKSLFIFLSGNLESNFNKVWVFLDTVTGQGQNRLLGNNVSLDFNGLNRLGESSPGMGDGLKFDAGFDADYALTATNGGDPVMTFANLGELPTDGNGAGRFVGQAQNPDPIVVTPCEPVPLPVPHADKAYGSELDAAYGIVCDNFLHLFLAGNLEVNGNNIDIFFDVDSQTAAAGQATLRADNVSIAFGGLNRMGGPGNEGPGLTFDAGFTADYWVSFRNTGFGVDDPVEMSSEASFLRTTGAAGDVTGAQGLLDYGSFTSGPKATVNPLSYDGTYCVRDVEGECLPNGAGTAWNPMSLPGIDVQGDLNQIANTLPTVAEIFASFAPRLISANPFDPLGTQSPNPNLTFPGLIQASINNSNIAGVTGESAAGAAEVTTGFEMRIRIDELGWDGVSPIRVVAFINSGNHDFLSNQVVGGLPMGQGNLGEPRLVDFNTFAGDQFVVIPVGTCPIAATGACCAGTTCSVESAGACVGANRSFAGNGTICNAPGNATTPCCKADYNQNGSITVQDIFDFLSGYFAQNPLADINGGGTTVQDIFDFLSAYFGGCA